jgi:hypothetical protein
MWIVGLVGAAAAGTVIAIVASSGDSDPIVASVAAPSPPVVPASPIEAAKPEVAVDAAVAIEEPPRRIDRPAAGRARATPQAEKTRGFVAIGGDAVHLGDISVDGVRVGTAPRLLELPTGRHSIQVTFGDGRHLGPINVIVSEHDTRTRPARPRLVP